MENQKVKKVFRSRISVLKAINPTITINVSLKKGAWRVQDWDI